VAEGNPRCGEIFIKAVGLVEVLAGQIELSDEEVVAADAVPGVS